jgi:hypothetical protein
VFDIIYPIFLSIALLVTFEICRNYWVWVLYVFGFVYNFPLFVRKVFYYILATGVGWYADKKFDKGKLTRAINWKFFLLSRFFRSSRIYREEMSTFITGRKDMITIEEVGDEVEYIPESERGADQPTKFYFEKKEREEIVRRRDDLVEVEDAEISRYKSSTVAYELTLFQLCGWENVADKNGEMIPFDEDTKQDLYDKLPLAIQDELEGEFGSGATSQAEDEE